MTADHETVVNELVLTDLDAHRTLVAGMAALVPQLAEIAAEMCRRFAAGGFVYTCGNGGSAADAQHLTGELIGRYKRERRPLPAVTLSVDPSVLTCIANDYGYDDAFARQARALVRAPDMLVAFTTSGRSPSILRALEVARSRGAYTVVFTGEPGAGVRADQTVVIADRATARIQEMHVLCLHLISDVVDRWAVTTEDRGAPQTVDLDDGTPTRPTTGRQPPLPSADT